MKKLYFCLFSFFLSASAFADAPVMEVGTYKDIVNNIVGDFVKEIVSGSGSGASNDFGDFSNALVLAGAFIGLVWSMAKWVTKRNDLVDTVADVLLITLFLSIYAAYDSITSTFWGFSDSLAAGITFAATGTTDANYIYNEVSNTISNIFISDDTWGFSSAALWGYGYGMISFILNAVLYIVSLWTMWGYAFCKITGLLFFGLWFVPMTRPYFVKWLTLFFGFWFFNLFSQTAMSIYYLYFRETIGFLTSPVEYDVSEHLYQIQLISLHMTIGIFFIIAAGGMASAVASGTEGVARSASQGAKSMAATLVKAAAKFKGA